MLASTISNRSLSSNGTKKYTRPTPAYSVQATRAPSTSSNGAPHAQLPDGVIGAAVNGVHDYRAALDKGGAVDWLEGKKHPANIGHRLPNAARQDAPLESSTFADSEAFPPPKEWPRTSQVTSALQSQRLPAYMRDAAPPPLPATRKSVKAADGICGVGLRLLQAPGKRPCVSDYSPSSKKDPAMKNKICIGDIVMMVNGKGVTSMHTVEDVEKMMAGPKGSNCSLRLLRRVPMADTYTRQRLLEEEGTTEAEEGIAYGVDLPRLDEEVSTIIQETPTQETSNGTVPDFDGDRLIVRVPKWSGANRDEDYGEEPLWAVEQATRRGLVYEPGRGFIVPAQLMAILKPEGWDEQEPESDSPKEQPPLVSIDTGRPLSVLSPEEDVMVRHEQMVQQFNDLSHQRGGQQAPAEVTQLMRDILDSQERSLVPRADRPLAPLATEVSNLQQSNQEITRAALSLYTKYLAHSNAAPSAVDAAVHNEEVLQLKHALQAVREDADAKTKELVKLRANVDVAIGKLQLEKSTVEARLRAEIEVLRQGLDNAREYAALREKMGQLLEVKETVLADREVLQLELDRVKANRLNDGKQQMSTGLEADMSAGGMTRAIVADIETLSLTNAQLVLDLHRLKDEKQELDDEKQQLKGDRSRLEEIVDRKNEELFGLQNDVLELREIAKEHAVLKPENAELKSENANLLARAEEAQRALSEYQQQMADQEKEFARRKKELEQEHKDLKAQLRKEAEEDRVELRHMRVERQEMADRTAQAELKFEEATRDQVLKEEAMKTQLQAAQAEAELQKRTVADLRKGLMKESENNRQVFNVLQGDIKTSNETLRTALATALAELEQAKNAVEIAESEVAEKNKVNSTQADKILELQDKLNAANGQLPAGQMPDSSSSQPAAPP